MIKYVVIEKGTDDFFIVDDLNKLIEEMYGEYNDAVIESFYTIHHILKVNGTVEDISRDWLN